MTEPSCPRVFCIGRNYAEHIAELGGVDDGRCVIFMKPASCLVPEDTAVRLPRGEGAVHHEAELVVEIGRAGRDIDRDAALPHVRAVTLGLDLTLRDLQNRLRAEGAPWERCKAFEQSAPLGERVAYRENAIDLDDLTFTCRVNGELRQQGNTAHMLFPVARLIALLSRSWQLQPGDLIYTGTPAGVGPVVAGDRVTLASPTLGEFGWDMV